MLDLIRKLWYSLHRTKTVYKVVSSGSYRSALARGNAMVEYGVGRWATAPAKFSIKGYNLTCFRHPRNAIAFAVAEQNYSAYSAPRLEVWRARACGVKTSLPQKRIILESGWIETFYDYTGWPEGTIMAKAIRLEEKIWDSKEGE